MLNYRTALLLSFMSKIKETYGEIVISGLSFKQAGMLDEYIKKASSRFGGTNLLRSPKIMKAIKRGDELFRFKINFTTDDGINTTMTFYCSDTVKLNLTKLPGKKFYPQIKKLCQMYSSL